MLGSALLASRGIYIVRPIDPRVAAEPKDVAKLAESIDKSSGVEYAEPNFETHLSDTRYHGWPEGDPEDAGTGAANWREQAVAGSLDLARAHRLSTGAGMVVAVLDSGVDASHPALAGRLRPGYDYVDDDDDPGEEMHESDRDSDDDGDRESTTTGMTTRQQRERNRARGVRARHVRRGNGDPRRARRRDHAAARHGQ